MPVLIRFAGAAVPTLLSGVLLACTASVPARTAPPSAAAPVSAPAASTTPAPPEAALAERLKAFDIPYTQHTLGNGLTLIVHEDHKAPIVAVNVWYHVGSKDERPGRTGFAHLFEHLMFNGSEHYDGEFMRPLEAVGASKMNGTTWYDRTNYFENVPTSALDLTLWLESDRMGHLVGAITQDKLDEQRNVVLNEKRQGDNQPYGRVDDVIARETYPAGHPYSWTTIGSEADLNAATLADVKQWFADNYGAANAVLVIAGDVKTDEVVAKVKHYFGDIPPGPVRQRHGAWPARMSGNKRSTLQDRVPQARLYQVWNVPGFCDRETTLLQMSAEILAGGKTSRLYERLVYRERVATQVSAGIGPFEIGSQLQLTTTVAPGVDPARVEAIINEELQRYLDQGPTAAEVERVKVGQEADFVRGLEVIDGFTGKSARLAEYQVYCGSPDYYKKELAWLFAATPGQLRDTARAWLSDGRYTLNVEPFPEYAVAAAGADRRQLPVPGPAPALTLPPLQRDTLSNGLRIVLAERHEVPIVQASLLVDAGYAADQGVKPGTARMVLDMLDEGTPTRDALAIAAQFDDLGARFGASGSLDAMLIGINALKSKLEPTLDLFADLLLHASFPDTELARLKQQRLAAIAQEKSQPMGLLSRNYPRLIYGDGHAYSVGRSGSGTEAAVKALTRDDLMAFRERWLRPDNAQLLIVGDTTLAEIKPLLEARLAGWKAPAAELPRKHFTEVSLPSAPRVFLINKTAADQSLIAAINLAPPKSDPDDIAMTVANGVLGGLFNSRLNLNLRENKRWSYGAFSTLGTTREARPFLAYAPVQADKTVESMREIDRELRAFIGGKGVTPAELKLAADNITVGLPGDNETAGDVAGSYLNILQFGLPDSYYNDLVPIVQGLTTAQADAAARRFVKPDRLTWVVVGDLSKIEKPIRALKLGEVKVLDADGNVVR